MIVDANGNYQVVATKVTTALGHEFCIAAATLPELRIAYECLNQQKLHPMNVPFTGIACNTATMVKGHTSTYVLKYQNKELLAHVEELRFALIAISSEAKQQDSEFAQLVAHCANDALLKSDKLSTVSVDKKGGAA